MIQIRNVPNELHRALKVQAARAGMTLWDLLLSEIEWIAEKPTMKEWLELLGEIEPLEVDELAQVTISRMWDAADPRDVA